VKWVTINKLVELSGYTENGIRGKKKSGVWLINKHLIKAPDGRVLFNQKAISEWMEGN